MEKYKVNGLIIFILILLVATPLIAQEYDGLLLKRNTSAQLNSSSLSFEYTEKFGEFYHVQAPSALSSQSDAGADPCIQYKYTGYDCEKNWIYKIDATPNDTNYNLLWGMAKINAPQAWDLSQGSQNVIVAVIDTGIDYNHPDLAANMWTNPNEIASNGVDDDGNGVIDDVHGYNAITGTGNPMDGNGHGTHCAGTIGGVGNNSRGVAGVNWNVKMIGAKFLADNGSGSLLDAIKAIRYITRLKTQKNINVLATNNSWGGGGYSQALKDVIQEASNAGIIFVAAAGNASNDNDASPSYPASYDVANVISVAAIDSNDNLASFSNYGRTQVDIAAPGVSIYSSLPGGGYTYLSGTSMATPHVTGALALLKSYAGNLPMATMIERLYNTGVPMNTLTNVIKTGKRIDLNNMLRNSESSPPPPSDDDQHACNYESQALSAYAGISSSDLASLELIGEDKDEFYTAYAGIQVPFYDETHNSFYLSPNGVVYFRSPPTNMDYKPDQGISMKSISAFQTDLVSNLYAGTLGDGRKVIAWEAAPFLDRDNGKAIISLIWETDGSIISSIKTDSLNFGNVLMGLKNQIDESELEHYQGSSSALPSKNYSVRYVKSCGPGGGNGGGQDDSGKVTSLKAQRIDNSANRKSNQSKNTKLLVKYNNMSELLANISIAGYACSNQMTISVNERGRTQVKLWTPRYLKVTFAVGGKEESLRGNRRSKNRSRYRNLLSDTKGEELCAKVLASAK